MQGAWGQQASGSALEKVPTPIDVGSFSDSKAILEVRARKERDRHIPPPPMPDVASMIRYSDDLVKTVS